ncbi:MAG: Uma2 family endonuclease, partial [Bacteroidota bacterium]
GCEVLMNDVKLQVKNIQDEAFYYPDLMVICGDVQVSDTHKDIVLNPILIIEVLSASTEKRDRGIKFQDYQKIDSLKEYVLISQEEYSVEVFSRDLQGEAWIYRRYEEYMVSLNSLKLKFSLEDIYQDIHFVNS